METSPQLSNENFSYHWSICSSSSFDDAINGGNSSFNSINGGSFFEMDPHFLSMRWNMDKELPINDFDFDLPRCQSPPLVNADEIFSDGVLIPSFHGTSPSSTQASSIMSRDHSTSSKALLSLRSSRRSSAIFHSAQSTPSSMTPCSSRDIAPKISAKFRHHPHPPPPPLVRSCIKCPKKILAKYLSFLIPLFKKVRGLRFKPSKPARSCKDSVRGSTRTAAAFPGFEWCRSNADISIYDAILYCKRSNGQDN